MSFLLKTIWRAKEPDLLLLNKYLKTDSASTESVITTVLTCGVSRNEHRNTLGEVNYKKEEEINHVPVSTQKQMQIKGEDI